MKKNCIMNYLSLSNSYFDKAVGMRPLSSSDLIKLLKGVPHESVVKNDSYIYSPVYYLFTGRYGLWSYIRGSIIINILRHPNNQESFLIMPAFNYENGLLSIEVTIDTAIELHKNHPELCFTLARIPSTWHGIMREELKCKEISELDWIFPCRVLSTQLVDNMVGKHFQQVRQRINHLDIKNLSVSDIDINKDSPELLELVQDWAMIRNMSGYTIEDLVSPTKKIIDLFKSSRLNLHGIKIKCNNRVESFCIYEVKGLIANEFSIISNVDIVGLAEYQMHQMCHHLHLRGVEYINLGGSETEGLDRFKKKFHPVISHNLNSYSYF